VGLEPERSGRPNKVAGDMYLEADPTLVIVHPPRAVEVRVKELAACRADYGGRGNAAEVAGKEERLE